ncbi:hypothetical protein IQ22_00395 [Pseudomonas duriflava]|uniref:Uncharacterized protein n=1 Tax=Pseudomonas duriflava TaxID=459528 RepID=A0A562QPN7_9PSED|nr:hypothetical protein [Pseudomonas duriflava]TWI58687.1 hypothetical protein IQ22_00395 [Pseudomonas duriflava]
MSIPPRETWEALYARPMIEGRAFIEGRYGNSLNAFDQYTELKATCSKL